MATSVPDRLKKATLVTYMHQLLWEKWLMMNKYRLLDLVNGERDADGNWDQIAEFFHEIGGDRNELHYVYLNGDDILLLIGKPKKFKPKSDI